MAANRNLPCPCGSGKKLKKCCLDEAQVLPARLAQPARPPRSPLAAYNSLDLAQVAAALSVLPENHGKAIRLELLLGEILEAFNPDGPVLALPRLEQFLDRNYPSHYLEDPPTNLLTDLVPFYGGDYLVFPGITEGGSFVLTNLLAAIFKGPDAALSVPFKINCHAAAVFLLGLSNRLALQLGYARYQEGHTTEEKLFLPSAAVLESIKAALLVPEEEWTQLAPPGPAGEWLRETFACTATEFQAQNRRSEESYLLQKPLLRVGQALLLASPLNISHALTEFIWAQARQWGCQQELRAAYRHHMWDNLQLQLKLMGFRPEAVPAAMLDFAPNALAGVYRFDADKIALVRLVGSGSMGARPAAKAAIDALLSLPQYAGHHVLDLQVGSREDGDLLLTQFAPGANRESLIVPVQEFDALSALNDSDAVDLWKFAVAKRVQFQRGRQPSFGVSFLDEFKVYRQNQDSFYVSDEARPSVLHIAAGHAADWLAAAKKAVDYHSVPLLANGRASTFPVKRKSPYGPIYYNVNDVRRSQLRFLVEGYPQPVWVEPATMLAPPTGALRDWFYQLNDALAYWLWQIQPGLRPFLDHAQLDVVHVTYECQPLAQFAEVARDYTRVADLAGCFRTRATADEVTVVIPVQLLPYLYGSDNEGERVLVGQMLAAFNQLLALRGLLQLSAATIAAILDEHVPAGMKKKIFMLDTADNLLADPRHLVAKRTVQEYDTSLVLDSLVPALQARGLCPPVGGIAAQQGKQQLTTNIVLEVLLPRLLLAARQFDQRDLLVKLLALNESLIYHREQLRIHTPSRIACFVSEEQQVEEVRENLELSSRTSIAVRCLIEHLSADQSDQGRHASTTDIDELVALMDQLMMWGSLDDQLHFGLFDIEMEILPTLRVGFEKKPMQDVLDPYRTAKTREDVADAIKSYQQVFPQQAPVAGSDVPEHLDLAFQADYGISFTRLCAFIDALGMLALGIEESVAAVPLAEVRRVLQPPEGDFGEQEFLAALDYLSLVKRDNVQEPPPGYDYTDIQPWRFSRRYSLLVKPVVVFDNPADEHNPTLYWGFRQLLTSRSYLAELILSNRLRVPHTSEMKKALGTIAGERGRPLVERIARRLAADDLILDTEVGIGPSGKLRHKQDIGDVDVFIIHPALRKIFSLECKNMAPSRNIREMVEELHKLLGANGKKGWVHKHVARQQWLEQNRDKVGALYGMDVTGFAVESLMVTSEDMLTPYLKSHQLPIRFVTSYDIASHGLAALLLPAPAVLPSSPSAEV
jgi:hypothetical protein